MQNNDPHFANYIPRSDLLQQIDEKDRLIELMSIDPDYGCYTKAALKYIQWPKIKDSVEYCIVFDIDDMKLHNDIRKWDGMNQLIKRALQLRRDDITGVYRWQSGDEGVIFLVKSPDRPQPIQPAKVASRLWRNFDEEGVGITGAIVSIVPGMDDLDAIVKLGSDRVQTMKKNPKQKGSIYFADLLIRGSFTE